MKSIKPLRGKSLSSLTAMRTTSAAPFLPSCKRSSSRRAVALLDVDIGRKRRVGVKRRQNRASLDEALLGGDDSRDHAVKRCSNPCRLELELGEISIRSHAHERHCCFRSIGLHGDETVSILGPRRIKLMLEVAQSSLHTLYLGLRFLQLELGRPRVKLEQYISLLDSLPRLP